MTAALTAAAGTGWRTAAVRADCFGEQGADLAVVTRPLTLTVEGKLTIRLASANLVAAPPGASCAL